MYCVTASQMREMDQQTIESFGLPGRLLMENAGYGATRVLNTHFKDLNKKLVAVLAGRGNNGGDGFVIARYLAQAGIRVSVYLLSKSSEVKGDAKDNLKLLAPLNIPVIEIPDKSHFEKQKISILHHDIYIDAIFGTGLKSEIGGIFKDAIELVNNSGKPVFAVDIPSGLDADTGHPHGICIRAHTTATFAYPKIGHILLPGASFTGNLEVVDIGIPPHIAADVAPSQFLLTDDIIHNHIQRRSLDSHKGTTGHLLILSGSPGKTGASVLTATAAMRSGAGLVTLGIPASLNSILESQLVEAMTYPLPEDKTGRFTEATFDAIKNVLDGKKCVAIGPGLGVSEGTKKFVNKIISEIEIPLVIDADGLNCIAENCDILKKRKQPTILTPHPGEMARLANTSVSSIQNDRVTSACAFAKNLNVHLILKGAKTVIAHPDGTIYINTNGNPGMASGGMGDVLTGIIGSLVAQGYTPESASLLGVYIHGAAADTLSKEYGPVGYIASDVIDTLPIELSEFTS